MGNKSILHNHFSYFNVTYLEYIFIKPIFQLFHIFQTFLQYIIIKIFKHFYEIDTSHGNARTKVNSVSSSSTCRLKHQRMTPIFAVRYMHFVMFVSFAKWLEPLRPYLRGKSSYSDDSNIHGLVIS